MNDIAFRDIGGIGYYFTEKQYDIITSSKDNDKNFLRGFVECICCVADFINANHLHLYELSYKPTNEYDDLVTSFDSYKDLIKHLLFYRDLIITDCEYKNKNR